MNKNIKLLTGIPRSGTTLCCHLLNQQENTIALHEPLNPASLSNSESVVDTTLQVIQQMRVDILQAKPIEHGDKRGLIVSNPVGENVDPDTGKRAVTSSRGQVLVEGYANKQFELYIKQNAFFTAHIDALKVFFQMYCIVRNPVDVLLSWWTVDLPVSRGRLPAGENNSPTLKARLAKLDEFERQIAIYEWFFSQFVMANLPIISYESIIESRGNRLFDTLGIKDSVPLDLSMKNRGFDAKTIEKLIVNKDKIERINSFGYYKQEMIASRIGRILAEHL